MRSCLCLLVLFVSGCAATSTVNEVGKYVYDLRAEETHANTQGEVVITAGVYRMHVIGADVRVGTRQVFSTPECVSACIEKASIVRTDKIFINPEITIPGGSGPYASLYDCSWYVYPAAKLYDSGAAEVQLSSLLGHDISTIGVGDVFSYELNGETRKIAVSKFRYSANELGAYHESSGAPLLRGILYVPAIIVDIVTLPFQFIAFMLDDIVD